MIQKELGGSFQSKHKESISAGKSAAYFLAILAAIGLVGWVIQSIPFLGFILTTLIIVLAFFVYKNLKD